MKIPLLFCIAVIALCGCKSRDTDGLFVIIKIDTERSGRFEYVPNIQVETRDDWGRLLAGKKATWRTYEKQDENGITWACTDISGSNNGEVTYYLRTARRAESNGDIIINIEAQFPVACLYNNYKLVDISGMIGSHDQIQENGRIVLTGSHSIRLKRAKPMTSCLEGLLPK